MKPTDPVTKIQLAKTALIETMRPLVTPGGIIALQVTALVQIGDEVASGVGVTLGIDDERVRLLEKVLHELWSPSAIRGEREPLSIPIRQRN